MSAQPEEVVVGWRVLDADGNVVDQGGVTKGSLVGSIKQAIEQSVEE